MSYQPHPLADLLPSMTDGDFKQLCESITREGLLNPIVLYEGKILDGRHRYAACEQTMVAPKFVTYDGDTPAAFVLAQNVERRHLTVSQRAMLATTFLSELEREAKARQREAGQNYGRGLDSSGSEEPKLSTQPQRAVERAGEMVGVSPASVKRAKRVADQAPDLVEQIRDGEMTVTAAEQTIVKDTPRRHIVTSNANIENVNSALARLTGLALSLAEFDPTRVITTLTAEQAQDWHRALDGAMRDLRTFRSSIPKDL